MEWPDRRDNQDIVFGFGDNFEIPNTAFYITKNDD